MPRDDALRYDERKADEMALALLHLNAFRDGSILRAWKGMPWEITDRLFEEGHILDPKSAAKSVVFTPEGAARAERLFRKHFSLDGEPGE